MIESADYHICSYCIGDPSLSKWIDNNGATGKCDFDKSHGKSNKVVTVGEFAFEVDNFFRQNYQLGDEYPYYDDDRDSPTYVQYGQPYREILADELDCNDRVLDAIAENLPDLDDYEIRDGGEPFYNEFSHYESLAEAQRRAYLDAEDWHEAKLYDTTSYKWENFCQTVKFERRFFKVKNILDDLFQEPENYKNGDIKSLYTLKAGTRILRGRVLSDELTENVINKDPFNCLGAPPPIKTIAGRMNVNFIPAFYGAFDAMTVIAEVRPSIGDVVAIGEFLLEQDITVFDFTAYDKAYEPHRPSEYISDGSRYGFIRDMQEEISKPISSFQQSIEYIPTQIVAEYLREHFECDAVIYKSSVHIDANSDTRNIVIFNRNPSYIFTQLNEPDPDTGSLVKYVPASFGALLKYRSYTLRSIKDIQYTVAKAVSAFNTKAV